MSIERKTAKDPISHSADIVGDNIEKLKQLFPSVFTEGKIDFTALRDELGDEVETDPEYYRFTWPGKQKAKAEARKPSRGTLRPAPEESVDWETTENLYIEGDNLEVLKLLQKSYAGKIKMIYIDPPYNTGKDFVYKDNYKDNLASYNEQFNRYDEEGNLKSSAAETNQEGHARYHSNWLNMMYPRLTLARNLLTEDGVIFISIDDNEIENLLKLNNELFGESNFIANIIWLNKEGGGSSDSKYFRVKREFIVCYSKLKDNVEIIGNEITNRERYASTDVHLEKRGPYYLQKLGMGSIQYSKSLDYEINCPDGSVVKPADNNNGKKACWRWSQEKYSWGVANDFIEIKKDSKDIWTIYTKQYLNADNEGNIITRTQRPYSTIENFSSTQAAKNLDKLNLKNYFDYTKPDGLIKYLIKRINVDNQIVLDFFSGSATTAHAVMELNAKDGGKRKHIQVQLPEPTDLKSEAYKAGYKNIAEIGKERIRRAGKKILEESPKLKGKLDVGFKVFKLDESNIKTWETDPEKLEQNLLMEDVIKEDRSEQDVIYEILLKYGLDLTLPIQEKIVNKHKLFAIGGGALLVCLDDDITPKTAQTIIDWARELGAINPQVVFKDSGFANSQDKVNVMQLLKSNGMKDVWSI